MKVFQQASSSLMHTEARTMPCAQSFAQHEVVFVIRAQTRECGWCPGRCRRAYATREGGKITTAP